MAEDHEIAVIGGGFFGCCLALFLRSLTERVVLIEREGSLMERASAQNQARLHAGFHYPRSFLTAARSNANLGRFRSYFGEAVVDDFEMLYALARRGSKVSAKRFETMFRKLGSRIEPPTPRQGALFDSEFVEGVYRCREWAFDWRRLRQLLLDRLSRSGVALRFETEVTGAEQAPGGDAIVLHLKNGEALTVREAFNVTYGQINSVLRESGASSLEMKYELAEIALGLPPKELNDIGVTVMDGPFFSCMPFPAEGLHSLTHVRYTPHFAWTDETASGSAYEMAEALECETRWRQMRNDAERYLPALKGFEYKRSLFEVKTILSRSEGDDGRPILFQRTPQLLKLVSVLGGKLDNVFDLFDATLEADRRWSAADDRYLR